jgi:hypothetical protein
MIGMASALMFDAHDAQAYVAKRARAISTRSKLVGWRYTEPDRQLRSCAQMPDHPHDPPK